MSNQETNQQKPLTAEKIKTDEDQIFLIYDKHMKIWRENELEIGYNRNKAVLDSHREYAKSLLEQKDREIAELKETNAQLRENFIAVQVQYGEKCAEYTAERQRSARLVEALKHVNEERIIGATNHYKINAVLNDYNNIVSANESTASAGEGAKGE